MIKVLEVALSQVGYLEKATNKDLDDFTANAGKNNYTKYARDLDAIPNFYNGRKNGFAWCDVFVDWCFVEAYGVDMGKRLLCQPDKSLGAGCKYSANYYKTYGQFYKTNPKVGDQIFFGNDADVAHTGLVYKVDEKKVYTVEGNTSGASGVIANGGGVCKKSYSLSYAKIYGYGRPNYSLVDGADSDIDYDKDTKGDVIVNLQTLEKGMKGKEVETLQALLIFKFGISCGVYAMDGDFGSATDKAVREFQKKYDLEIDGIVGKNTWNALLRG